MSKAIFLANRRSFVGGVGLIAGGAWASPFGSARAVSANSEPALETTVLDTDAGKVSGHRRVGVHVFKGVPYGGSTAARNRFMPPTAVMPWRGVRDASQFSAHAPQNRSDYGVAVEQLLFPFPYEATQESEDCLTLNAWTAGIGDGARRPIMVWLHGGGFESGSGNAWIYDGENLARRGDVVVVTVNHRLNAFGYLHLGDLGQERYAHSGNAGLLDVIAALHWVRDHAERLGGDPTNVTLFGQSGGGGKVSMLLAMPGAKGLFHKAIIQSGPGLRAQTREAATRLTSAYLKELGISPSALDHLAELPAAQLLSAIKPAARAAAAGRSLLPGFPDLLPSFGPVLDPVDLPHHPFDPVANPLSDNVPMIVGSTAEETALFSTRDAEVWGRTLSMEALGQRLASTIGAAHANGVIDAYRHHYPNKVAAELFILITTDMSNGQRSIMLAEAKSNRHSDSVYMYKFGWRVPGFDGKFMACHAADLGFTFYNLDHAPNLTSGDEAALSLAQRISDSYMHFARTGRPDIPGEPWPAYDTATRSTMLFDTECRVVDDPAADLRRLWQTMSA